MFKTILEHRDGRTVTTPHTIQINKQDSTTLQLEFWIPDTDSVVTETYDAHEWRITHIQQSTSHTTTENTRLSTLTPYDTTSPTWCVSNNERTLGPYESIEITEEKETILENKTSENWVVYDTITVLQTREIPFPSTKNEFGIERVVNYQDIREGLDFILEESAPDRRDEILSMLDDAITHNTDQLQIKPPTS